MRKLFIAAIVAAVVAVAVAASVAAYIEGGWPETCLEMNDMVEASPRGSGAVGIYQGAFGDEAEAACQNDHREDIRQAFAWAFFPESVSQATEYSLGDQITLDASKLVRFSGGPDPVGSVTLTFELAGKASSVTHTLYGNQEAEGTFVVVYYSITNDASAWIEPFGQINKQCMLIDDRGRQWEIAGYSTHGFDVSASFSELAGGSDPKGNIPPGFTRITAIAFDVPSNATGLRIHSKQLGITVSLGN